jgi:hypothetical protein
MIPEFLVDDEEVLPVRLPDMNLTHVAEVRDSGLSRIGNGESQKHNE